MPTTVTPSHLDKELFPKNAITKGELIEHYRAVAGRMLPHLQDRPLAVRRYPDGIDGESIFQQAVPPDAPSWLRRASVPDGDGEVSRLLCQDEQTLVYLADQAAVTLQTWLSRIDLPEHPDQVLFDLDPPHDFDEAVQAALALRGLLDELGLPSLVKTTGRRGLHVSVPLVRRYQAEELRNFARSVRATLALREPERFTDEMSKDKRGNRPFVDVSRNGYGESAVAPYTVRANPDALVATPVGWSELEEASMTPEQFTLRDMAQRLDQPDPWRDPPEPVSSLATARERIGDLPT